MQQSGGDRAHAIDLTSLDDSDIDGYINVGNSSKSSVSPIGRPPVLKSRSSESLDASPNTVNLKIEQSREPSSDDNDLILALRKGRGGPNHQQVVKRKCPPGNANNIGVVWPFSQSTDRDNKSVNTSILLNLDLDEEVEENDRKRRKIDEYNDKSPQYAPGIPSQVVDNHHSAQRNNHYQPDQDIPSKALEQDTPIQRASSADVVDIRAAKKPPRWKGTPKLLRRDKGQHHSHGPARGIKPDVNNSYVVSSEAGGDGPRGNPAPVNSQQMTTSTEFKTKEKSAKNAGAARISEAKISKAAAQFKALAAPHSKQRNTPLADLTGSARRRAVPSSTARANGRPQPPRQSQPSSQSQLPQHPRPPPRSQPPRQSQPSSRPQALRQVHRTTEPRQSRPRPSTRPPPINEEELRNAAAQFQTLQAQYPQPRQTILIDRPPVGTYPRPMPAARRVNNPSGNDQEPIVIRERQTAQRRRRIEIEVNRKFAQESEEQRARIVARKFDEYLERRRRREVARIRTRHEDHLTVEGLEAMGEVSTGSEEDEREEPVTRKVPFSQALEATNSGFVTQYVVFASKPHKGCGDGEHVECLRRTQAFDELELANAYAEQLLKGPSTRLPKKGSRASALKAKKPPAKLQIDSYQERYKNGMLSGLLTLTNGKAVFCEVRKENQAVGALDPALLRKKWAREEFIQSYRKRYDVWMIKIIPTAFSEREEQDGRKEIVERGEHEENGGEHEENEEETVATEAPEDKSQDRGENRGENRGEEAPITPALEGGELRAALANLPAPNTNQDTSTQDENSDYDAASEAISAISSTSTLQPERPSSPPRISYSAPARHPGPNPWLYEEYRPILCGSYTDRRLANTQAFSAAETGWKPRTASMDAWEHYQGAVREAIRREREATDLDGDLADIEFPVPAWHGHDDHRPWGFVHSRVLVQETTLEGPRDIGAEFVGEDEGAPGDSAEVVQGVQQPVASADPIDAEPSAQDRPVCVGGDEGDEGGAVGGNTSLVGELSEAVDEES